MVVPESLAADRPLALIGSAIGWGSGRRMGASGAFRLRDGGLAARLRAQGIAADWHAFIEEHPSSIGAEAVAPELALARVAGHGAALAQAVRSALESGRLPVTLGGDNAGSIGHYVGLTQVTRPLGLIWIDAHPDSNTWQTSPSKAAHGMVVSTITGHGPEVLPRPAAGAIPLSAITMIGIRTVDPGEQAFIDYHGIEVAPAADATRRGLTTILAEALSRALTGTAGFGISIDLDAVDPTQAPGVAFPEPAGLDADALCAALDGLGRHPACVGIEISEFASEFDRDGRTERLIERLLTALLAGR